MTSLKTISYGIEKNQEILEQLERMVKRTLKIIGEQKAAIRVVDGNAKNLTEDIELSISIINDEMEDVLELTLLEGGSENEILISVVRSERMNPTPSSEKLRVFEAFSGIGAQHQALKNIGVNFEIVGISEIDKFAIASYKAIHGEVPNFGDISKLEEKEISNIQMDIFTYSFPCQDISLAGHQKGLDKGSNTRSSLLWECEKVIKISRPKVLLMENVKNLVGKKNKPNFEKWLDLLESYGYTNYWKVLNAKDYGVPQNRERVFVVSILGEHKSFEFPKERLLNETLTDLLSDVADKKFYLSEKQIGRIKASTYNSARNRIQEKEYCDTLCARDYKDPKCVKVKKLEDVLEKSVDERVLEPLKVRSATKKGYQEATNGDIIDLAYPDSTTRRGRVKKGYAHTITTNDNIGVLDGYRVRKLTPLECWRLMGFRDEEFYKAEKVNSNAQLYKQAGNSIVVDVLEEIFKEIIKSIQK